ncbi:TPA: hypothetical protein DIV48_02150, partial [Candidatus Kaiserbacteria bacterium]|nr:hypothetical protein [Candidatus Kaiserbacteria bacterium]
MNAAANSASRNRPRQVAVIVVGYKRRPDIDDPPDAIPRPANNEETTAMPKTRATAAPAKAGDKRKDDDRREKSERRLT